MFVFTARITKAKLIVAVVGLAVLLGLIIVLVTVLGSPSPEASEYEDHSVLAIKSNDDRVAFLSSCGWEVDPQPVSAEEIKIPEAFDEVYAKYNELQKTQNYNLEDYKGKRVKRYTYEIKNYPTGESGILANLLVYQDGIIGGDVSSPDIGGFMHGFAKPK